METRQFARWYAKRGFHIFPCHTIENGKCTCGKDACGSPGKHPVATLAGHGVLDATTDLSIIEQWWSMFPDANIAIATGAVSGVAVVDIDPDHGGEVSWENLTNLHPDTEDTWAVVTGSGGIHFYFEAAEGVRNSASLIGPGIDVRSDGGYVIAPPSLHVSGERYAWSEAYSFKTIPVPAPMPDWLLKRLVPRALQAQGAAPLPEKITEGARNQWMASIAGTMRRRGMSRAAIEAALKVENRIRCVPQLDEREVERIAQSIDRYPASVSGLGANGWRAAS